MKIVNMHEAKTHLSRLVQAVLEGEEVVIARANVPMVRLVLIEEHKPERRLGFARDRIVLTEDFDAPLADFEDYR